MRGHGKTLGDNEHIRYLECGDCFTGMYLSQNLSSYILEIHAIYRRSGTLQEHCFTKKFHPSDLDTVRFWDHWTKPEPSTPMPPQAEGCLFCFQLSRKNISLKKFF